MRNHLPKRAARVGAHRTRPWCPQLANIARKRLDCRFASERRTHPRDDPWTIGLFEWGHHRVIGALRCSPRRWLVAHWLVNIGPFSEASGTARFQGNVHGVVLLWNLGQRHVRLEHLPIGSTGHRYGRQKNARQMMYPARPAAIRMGMTIGGTIQSLIDPVMRVVAFP